MIEPLQTFAVVAPHRVVPEGFQRCEISGAGPSLDRLGQLKRRARPAVLLGGRVIDDDKAPKEANEGYKNG
ncbi:hypothetical protein GCM10017620_12360 [Brevundimonas intermedia]|uniref:Uncharacterized protein n=1 Tax=Brevundimonas intermedia TaxID=74315 RepID=A0ABQ5T7D9_9CAUL|nr:hypothetical protein GCM10017620_12360 [Brevundimonas intermedia]